MEYQNSVSLGAVPHFTSIFSQDSKQRATIA